LEREIFQTKFVEKIKPRTLCLTVFFPQKIVPFVKICWKVWWSQTAHRWRHNKAHALVMLGN